MLQLNLSVMAGASVFLHMYVGEQLFCGQCLSCKTHDDEKNIRGNTSAKIVPNMHLLWL